MSVRTPAIAELSSRPVTLTQLVPQELLPVPVAAREPSTSAKKLFILADRLVSDTHEAALGKGSYFGESTPQWLLRTMPVWGTALVVGAGVALGTTLGWDEPTPFFAGLVGGCLSLAAIGLGLERWQGPARAKPIPVTEARPYLDAFKAGEAQTQALVTRLATSASSLVAAKGVAGQEFRRQLDELAAVNVQLDSAATNRIDALCELANSMPRKHRLEATSTRLILAAFERLDVADRAELAPLLLAHLFKGERLRWAFRDTTSSAQLYNALIAMHPSGVTSREELQKLVAPVPSQTRPHD